MLRVAAGSIVGQWTCNFAETPVSGAWQSVYVINADGSWEMQQAIAPTQKLAGMIVRARGTYQAMGTGSAMLTTRQATASSDGVNWMSMPLPDPYPVQPQGDGLSIGGVACHRSG
jgi:hypothetical protein